MNWIFYYKTRYLLKKKFRNTEINHIIMRSPSSEVNLTFLWVPHLRERIGLMINFCVRRRILCWRRNSHNHWDNNPQEEEVGDKSKQRRHFWGAFEHFSHLSWCGKHMLDKWRFYRCIYLLQKQERNQENLHFILHCF